MRELQATYTTDAPSKEQLETLIREAPIGKIALYGGDLNNVDLTIDPPVASLRGLKLKDMPNVNLKPFLEKLHHYNLDNIDLIRLENLPVADFDAYVKPCLLASDGLKKFRFEINHDNFNACFDSVVEICAKHVHKLEHLSFAKTPVSTE